MDIEAVAGVVDVVVERRHLDLLADDRTAPESIRRLAGTVPERELLKRWREDLRRRRLLPGTMLRFERLPRQPGEGVGRLATDSDGLPILLGFTVKYRGQQYRSLRDGTPIHSIAAAHLALVELEDEFRTRGDDASPHRGGAADPPETITSADSAPAAGLPLPPEALTRAGRPLHLSAAPTFPPEQRTLAALEARMRVGLLNTADSRLTVYNLARLQKRVLHQDTRYDLIDGGGWKAIYTEIGRLHEWDDETRPRISHAYQNQMFGALVKAMDFAVEERSLADNLAHGVKRNPRGPKPEVPMLGMADLRRVEWRALAEEDVARRAVARGNVPQAIVVRGRHAIARVSPAVRVTERGLLRWDGVRVDVDIMVSAVGPVPLVGPVGHGRRYFASGMATMALLWSQIAPRQGELAALCWDFVDLRKGMLTLGRARQVDLPDLSGVGYSRGIQEFVKGGNEHARNARSPRVSDELLDALRRWHQDSAELQRLIGWTPPRADGGQPVVFVTTTGGLMRRGAELLIYGLQERAGVRRVPLHSARKSMESINGALEIPAAATGTVLGHTPQVGIDNYLRALDAHPRLVAGASMAWRHLLEAGLKEDDIVLRARVTGDLAGTLGTRLLGDTDSPQRRPPSRRKSAARDRAASAATARRAQPSAPELSNEEKLLRAIESEPRA